MPLPRFLGKLLGPATNLTTKVVTKVSRTTEDVQRDRHNVDIALSACLREGRLSEVRDPVAYVEFLRGCVEHTSYWVRPIKGTGSSSGSGAMRFGTLLDILKSGVPPLRFSEAQDVGLVADNLSNSLDVFHHKHERWH